MVEITEAATVSDTAGKYSAKTPESASNNLTIEFLEIVVP